MSKIEKIIGVVLLSIICTSIFSRAAAYNIPANKFVATIPNAVQSISMTAYGKDDKYEVIKEPEYTQEELIEFEEDKIAQSHIISDLDESIHSINLDTTNYIEVMDTVHEIAESAREAGLPEYNPIITKASELWWEAHDMFCYDRDILATVIYNEAWYDCSTRHRELVGAVVYNRVNSDLFPDTIYEVVTQPGQYLPEYADANSFYGMRAREDEENWKECQNIASRVLHGEVDCDSNVLFQANFVQGDEIYEVHYTSYSTTYFCQSYN